MTQAATFLTVSQVAALYDTHPETIRRWARDGLIPSVLMPSGRRKYRRDQIEAAIAEAGIPAESVSA